MKKGFIDKLKRAKGILSKAYYESSDFNKLVEVVIHASVRISFRAW
jgi:hypothetical protein